MASRGTHLKGPVLHSKRTRAGLYENVPLSPLNRALTEYKVWFEPFSNSLVDGQLDNLATRSALGAPAADSEVVTAALRCLQINAGTAVVTGTSWQFLYPGTLSTNIGALNTPGPIVSTTTLMDGSEMIWGCRFGINTDATDFLWDQSIILGVCVTDTTPIVAATGLPGLAAGGGIGFHIGIDGSMGYFAQEAALTAALPASQKFLTGMSGNVSTTPEIDWYEVGFRIKWTDASAGTGVAEFYADTSGTGTGTLSNGASILAGNGPLSRPADGMKFVGRITSGLPMQGANTYSTTFSVCNGAVQLVDFFVDYVYTAIKGPGRD